MKEARKSATNCYFLPVAVRRVFLGEQRVWFVRMSRNLVQFNTKLSGAGIPDPYVSPPLLSLLWRLLLVEDFWRVPASLRALSSSLRNWSTRALSPAA